MYFVIKVWDVETTKAFHFVNEWEDSKRKKVTSCSVSVLLRVRPTFTNFPNTRKNKTLTQR